MFWLFFIVSFININTITSECPPSKASIQTLLDKAFIPGVSLIVTKPNEILYQQQVGYQSPPIPDERQAINSSSSIFMLASISKTFVVVAAMQMVEANRLNLDADINEYLSPRMKISHPFFPNTAITTRHLLTHSSGIGLNIVEQDKYYLPGDTFIQTDLGELLENYLKINESWLPFPPGNITFYSNVGACLAAYIVERLAGISFEEYLHEKVLKVLDIDKTKASYRLSDFQNNKNGLVGHYIYNASWLQALQQEIPQLNITLAANNSDWIHVESFGIGIYPVGSLHMSATTLTLWLQSFMNNFTNILHNSSSIEEILHVSSQEYYKNLTSTKFGLIWYWDYYNGRHLVGHSGSVPGMTHGMFANEKRNLGVIVLTNADVTRGDSQSKQVGETMTELMGQLFDCFDED